MNHFECKIKQDQIDTMRTLRVKAEPEEPVELWQGQDLILVSQNMVQPLIDALQACIGEGGQMSDTNTLGDALPKEIARVKELISLYDTIKGGQLAAAIIRNDVAIAEKAMADGNVVGMICALKILKGFEE